MTDAEEEGCFAERGALRERTPSMRESIKKVSRSEHCAFAVSGDNRILAWNDAASDALGWSADAVVGRDAAEVVEPRDIFGNRWCPNYCGMREMFRRGEPIETMWFSLRKRNGELGSFFGSVTLVESNTGPGPGQSEGRDLDLLFEFRRERRRQTTGALIGRLLYPDGGPPQSLDGARNVGAQQLTARQKQVLSLLAEGFDPPHIAAQLGVSVNTVRNHIQRILVNLHCHSQANAVAIAIREGLI